MITLDMTRKAATKFVTDNAFTLEQGVLTLQVSLGTYSLTGKTVTAAFSPRLAETGALNVVAGVIQIPISPSLIQAGANEIQLNIRASGFLEQSPKMEWNVLESIIAATTPTDDPGILGTILADIAQAEIDIDALEAGKVDKVTGKALSTNDFTDAFETKLTDLPLAADLTISLGTKVDKVTGKELSDNNYTDAEVLIVADVVNKVDKVAGYALSQNDFTDTLESKLNGIEALADVTDSANVGSVLNGATTKATPIDADTLAFTDTEASNVLKKLTWANVKAFLKTYFDTLYNNYTHPANHSPSVISQDTSNRFVTDTEKTSWNAKEDASNKKTTLADNSDTYYPSQKAVKTAVDAKVDKIGNATITSSDVNPTVTLNANNASVAKITSYQKQGVEVAYIDDDGSYVGGVEQTTANKNKYYPLLRISTGALIATYSAFYWNGSAYAAHNSYGFGYYALYNNTGAYSNGFGHYALYNNTGANSNGFGYYALYNNTGANSNGFGNVALHNNTGANSNGFGYYALYNNTGANSNGFGNVALHNNTGANSNGFGHYALQNNTGANSNGFGYYALYNNTGANSNGFGNSALRYNQKDKNTVVGDSSYGSAFLDNTAGNKIAPYTAVDITLDRVTLTAHGFGATNAFVNIKYSATDGTAIGGLPVGTICQVKIIDANTIEFRTAARGTDITSQGTGNHTFTPQFAYTNTTCLGASTTPNKDNQVVLGDSLVDTIKMGGTTRTPASATATGFKGEVCWDASYIYVCVATNTWKRTAIATW